MSLGILPDCAACGGRVEVDGPVEACVDCGIAQRPAGPKVNRAEVRAQVAEVRRRQPLLCPSCLGRRCYGCRVMTCECPGRHPRRPAGDVSPEGMALLAGEKQGHLEPSDVPVGAR